MSNTNEKEVGVVATNTSEKMNFSAELVANAEAMANVLDDMDELMEITSEYLEFSKDYEGRFVYAGLVTMSGNGGEDIEAAKLMGTDGKFYVTASQVLVGSVKQINAPAPIGIRVLGKRKGKQGEYWDLKVSILGRK